MTAEIAIMNKTGMALAADSKATIGPGLKTFDTVNKVFTLSKLHPIGIMIYGNAEFMDYPIEVICKQFRAERGSRAEATVEGWADAFVNYLSTFAPMENDAIASNTCLALAAWLEEVGRSSLATARRKKIALTSPEYVKLLVDNLQRFTKRFDACDKLLDQHQQAKLFKQFSGSIEAVVQDFYGSYNDQALLDAAREFAVTVLACDEFSPRSTGIVVAGYGDKQLLPAIVALQTDGYIGKSLKIQRTHTSSITIDQPALLIPFAQKEMVQRFMDGIDPDYGRFLTLTFNRAIVRNCMQVLESYGLPEHKTDAVKADIIKAVTDSRRALEESIKKFQSEKFSSPILDMVQLLPKDELPHLAESLVALTSLKRHVSHDAETVGGPIDVALISKGDGFIWIKRKHYFKPELNPHFSANYLRGIRGEENVRRSTSRSGRGAQARRGKGDATDAGEASPPAGNGSAASG